MSIINRFPSGGGLKVGDITTKDKSGDSNFLLCDGREVNVAEYPKLQGILNGEALIRWVNGGTVSFSSLTVVSYSSLKLAYGNGVFMIVGGTGISTSTDNGATWISRTSGLAKDDDILKISYGNGTWIIVAGSNLSSVMLTSVDNGLTWVRRTHPLGSYNRPTGIIYGNGTWVISTYRSSIITSTDNGATWISRTSGLNVDGDSTVAYGNGKMVILSYGARKISISTNNGVTWLASSSTNEMLYAGSDIIFANGVWIAKSDGGTIIKSTDLITWEKRFVGFGKTNTSVPYYGNGTLVEISQNVECISTSVDNGDVWRVFSNNLGGVYGVSIAYGNNTWVLLTDQRRIITSSDKDFLYIPSGYLQPAYIKSK